MQCFLKNRRKSALIVLFGTFLLAACEHQIPLDAPADNGNNGNGGTQTQTLTMIQNTIFTRKCAVPGCHVGGSASAGLNLSTGQSFGELVNVTSTFGPPRVAPSDLGNSVLYQKVVGNSLFGSRMPQGGALSQSEIDMIAAWINDGAQNN